MANNQPWQVVPSPHTEETIYPSATNGFAAGTADKTIYTATPQQTENIITKQRYSTLSLIFFLLLLLSFFVSPAFFIIIIFVGAMLAFRSTVTPIPGAVYQESAVPQRTGPKKVIYSILKGLVIAASVVVLIIVGLFALLIVLISTGGVDFRMGS